MPPSNGRGMIGTVDACLSKAIRRLVLLSLAVHLVLLVKNSSKSMEGWLESSSTARYMEDFPTLASWGHDGVLNEHTNNYTFLTTPFYNASLNSTNASATYNLTKEIAPSLPSMEQQQQQLLSAADIRAPSTTHRIPLEDLILLSNPNATCNPGKSKKYLIDSTLLPESMTYSSQRKIPKIVHVTSKTRCMTPAFIRNIDQWRFPGYSLAFHDDVAVDRLLGKYWPEFPHLQLFQHCSVSGAAKADIWRLLVLWEYGGIYTDIDNAPGPKFQEGNIIQDEDDAWFVVERIGILSQYFMSASPKHPLIYATLTHLLQRLLAVENIRKQYVPYVTGPGAIKSGMMIFMKDDDKNHTFDKVKKGKYVGVVGRSVTVEGTRGHSQEFVKRESVTGIHKKGGYAAMGMSHFSKSDIHAPSSSCYEHLYKETKKLLNQQRLEAADWHKTSSSTTTSTLSTSPAA